MKKYIFFLMGAVCFLLSSSAVHANELNKSDANIIGHVLDKNTEEHLSFISVSLKGTTIGLTPVDTIFLKICLKENLPWR